MTTLSEEGARCALNHKLKQLRDYATPKQVEAIRIMGVSVAHMGRAELLGALCMVMSTAALFTTKPKDGE